MSNTSKETPLRIRRQPNSLRYNPLGRVRIQPHKRDELSSRYHSKPLEELHFELVDFVKEEHASSISNSKRQRSKPCDLKTSEMLTTSELISLVGQVWDSASRPLSVLQSKAKFEFPDTDCKKENVFRHVDGNSRTPTSANCNFYIVDIKDRSHFSSTVQPKLGNVKACEEKLPGHGTEFPTQSFFTKFLWGDTHKLNEISRVEGLATVRSSCNLKCIYNWMHEIALVGALFPANTRLTENKKVGDSRILENTISPASCCVREKQPDDCLVDRIKSIYSLPDGKEKAGGETNVSLASLNSDYFCGDDPVTVHEWLTTDNHTNFVASGSFASKQRQHESDGGDGLPCERKKQHKEFVLVNEPKKEIFPSRQDKRHYFLAKQEHAFAGALAGIFVSLCLHPVDTVKTVVQSCHANQNSISYISRSIISERGLTGLYRGITSNIVSSAPISALYTFTYESIKGALLPLLPKDYYSFAHCVAGGCASIATSFVFTPSERIKQQMQVYSHYENCWNALVGIVRNGGLNSLYTGWGAILCRNVPHSIIKFYTYESLKQLTLSSYQPSSQLSTLQTVVCGGLAGCTSALFTTPFDVVKTRLQTQIPGSADAYGGVFDTLRQIGIHEGLKGLFRGLLPRLVMYMSQGALFFASYESFKRLFSLEIAQLGANVNQHKPNSVDVPESSSL